MKTCHSPSERIGCFMREPKEIKLERSTYVWDGIRWYHARTFVTPPTVDILRLDALLSKAIQDEDQAIENIDDLLNRAHEARDALQHDRVGQIALRILKLEPGNGPAATLLCGSLRAQNRPAQALKATQAMRETDHAPLLVSRAAAWCDLEKWQEALTEVSRAQALGAGKLAAQVVKRIRAKSSKANKGGSTAAL